MAKKILTIDDDPEFTDAIVNLLDAKGYQVETASDGKKGLDKAKQFSPDLILLDVMMATKNEGFELLEQFKQNDDLKNIPVIMVTGIRNELNLPFSLEPDEDELPVKAVLEKPVKPDVLLRTIEKNI